MPSENAIHMGPGQWALEAEGYGPYSPVIWERARP